MLIEEILDLLVGYVDAQLLERIAASYSQVILETENVQQSDRQWLPTVQSVFRIADEMNQSFP